jgi:DNA-binding PadR family transcriptional regulator
MRERFEKFERFGQWREQRGFMRHGFGRGGDDGEHGGGRHWGRGRGGGRPFDHGELKLVVLVMVAERPRHGYEIIKEIEDRFGGSYTPSPGVVYPTLTMLEELGYATVEEMGGKKRYTVTDAGREYLTENQVAANAAMGRMGKGGDACGMPALRLIRALANLKMAVKMRQRSGPVTEESLRTIVAALDAAAVAIERS